MAHEVVSLAYREAFGVPWHRLGVPMQDKVTAAQAVQIGRGEYTVIKAPLFAQIGDLYISTEAAALYSNHSGEWTYLNTIKKGEKYEPVQNTQIAELLDTGDKDNLPLTDIFEMDVFGVLSEGKRSFFCLRMGEDTVKIGVDGDDHYVTHLHIYNDYTHNGALRVGMSLTRSVCLNTITFAMTEAEKDGKLWSFSHKSRPLDRLAFRLEFERKIQNARRKFYAELEAMTLIGFGESQIEMFAERLFPIPPVPGKVREAAMVRDDMRPEITEPVLDLAAQAGVVWYHRKEQAEANQQGLVARIKDYQQEFGTLSLYTLFQGATDYINWRTPERGEWNDVAESVMFGVRSQELERLGELSHAILSPGQNSKLDAKYEIDEFLSKN